MQLLFNVYEDRVKSTYKIHTQQLLKGKNMNQQTAARLLSKVIFLILFLTGGFFQVTHAWNKLGRTDSISDSLKYIGHSFVKIKTIEGKTIYIDPYNVNEFADSADVVLITHEHFDHNELFRVHQKSTCQVIRAANAVKDTVYQSFTIGNIKITKITGVAAYNNQSRNRQWHIKYQCVGYIVEFDGIKLYHAGDTGNIPEMADLASQNITYALLPMDSIYTMSPAEATQAAAMIQAKYDIPIHTMPAPSDTYSDAFVARFTSPNKLVIHPGVTIALENTPTSVGEKNEVPYLFSLRQNYPNPFNPTTTIKFTVQENGFTSLKVYNVLGQVVATLINAQLKAGSYEKMFDARNLVSGVYMYRLQSGQFNEVKKLMVLK
jgi:L-ascorbate metabolism protein UlaG (beta-lactamase superfamily)